MSTKKDLRGCSDTLSQDDIDASQSNIEKQLQAGFQNYKGITSDISNNLSSNKLNELKNNSKPSLVKRLTRVKMNQKKMMRKDKSEFL